MRYCGRCKRITEHYLFNGRLACKLCAFKRTNSAMARENS